jgi:hypothetical protein
MAVSTSNRYPVRLSVDQRERLTDLVRHGRSPAKKIRVRAGQGFGAFRGGDGAGVGQRRDGGRSGRPVGVHGRGVQGVAPAGRRTDPRGSRPSAAGGRSRRTSRAGGGVPVRFRLVGPLPKNPQIGCNEPRVEGRPLLGGSPTIQQVLAAEVLFHQHQVLPIRAANRLDAVGHVHPAGLAPHAFAGPKRPHVLPIG